MLKVPAKFGVFRQTFFQNQNPVQDQGHDFTLNFDTRNKLYT